MSDQALLTRPLLLISGDGALTRLIRLECRELALPLEVSDTWPVPLQGRTPLFDLDTPGVAAALADTVEELPAKAVSICRDEERLPMALRDGSMLLLHRPFATGQLRTLLRRMCNDGVLTLPCEDPAPTRRPALGIELSMESDTVVRCDGHLIKLTASEGALLRCLLQRRGQIVPKETLEDCLHGGTESNKVEVYLCFLRRKLERPLGLRLITTVRGVGYRLE